MAAVVSISWAPMAASSSVTVFHSAWSWVAVACKAAMRAFSACCRAADRRFSRAVASLASASMTIWPVRVFSPTSRAASTACPSFTCAVFSALLSPLAAARAMACAASCWPVSASACACWTSWRKLSSRAVSCPSCCSRLVATASAAMASAVCLAMSLSALATFSA
ncbi:hypothetical protein D3C84_822470 [compost metagenome]